MVNPAFGISADTKETKHKRKAKIPKALREQVWIQNAGSVFSTKCKIPWCENIITAFDFQCGHNIPESKGGTTSIDNLIPICSRCNGSMGNSYTIDEWSKNFNAHTISASSASTKRSQVQPLPLTGRGAAAETTVAVPIAEPLPASGWFRLCC